MIRRMRIACWITKATDTLLICNTLLFHGNSGYLNAPQCYVIRGLHCLVFWPREILCPVCNSVPCHTFRDCWLNCCAGRPDPLIYIYTFSDSLMLEHKYYQVGLGGKTSDLYLEVSYSNPYRDTDYHKYNCWWFPSVPPDSCHEIIVKEATAVFSFVPSSWFLYCLAFDVL
jgi:hypothetical protein